MLRKLPVLFFLVVFIFFSCLVYAWNDDYGSGQSYDSYSQNWQNYKQQNNINTQPAYQQSWWSSAVDNIGNFLADVGSAINNALNNVGSFFTTVYNNVHDFFIKPPDIKVGAGQAPPVGKDAVSQITDAGVMNHAPTLGNSRSLSVSAQDGTYRNEQNQSDKNKDNPYAYLTAEKACYDPRAIGLSQFSEQYKAIEAEYAARDKWQAATQQLQITNDKLQIIEPENTVGAIRESPIKDADSAAIDQKDISVIVSAQITHPDPSIMPAESWDRVKQTLPVNDAPKQTALTALSQKEAYIVPMDTDEYNPEEMKHADSGNFYDVFPFGQNVTVKQIADKIMTDFSTHNDFIPGVARNIEGAKDILQRAADVAISSVSGDVAGGVVKHAGANGMVSKGIEKVADIAVSNAMNNPQIKLLDNERIVFKNICDKISSELVAGAVQSFSFQRNIITDSEAVWRNNFDKTTSTIIGFIPYLGTAMGMIKSQPYADGQIEYKVQFDYLKDAPQSKLWRIDLEYRTGDYFTSSGTRERGVIESKYTQSYYDPQYAFVVEEGHHAP